MKRKLLKRLQQVGLRFQEIYRFLLVIVAQLLWQVAAHLQASPPKRLEPPAVAEPRKHELTPNVLCWQMQSTSGVLATGKLGPVEGTATSLKPHK